MCCRRCRGRAARPRPLSGRWTTWIPQLLDRCSTMARPRPPSADGDGYPARGRAGPPPSLTDTRSVPSQSVQATRTVQPGNGRACRIALLSSSLRTRAASPIAAATVPASRRSVASCPRAVATLDGAYGSRTTLAALTSPCPAQQTGLIEPDMPQGFIPETPTCPVCNTMHRRLRNSLPNGIPGIRYVTERLVCRRPDTAIRLGLGSLCGRRQGPPPARQGTSRGRGPVDAAPRTGTEICRHAGRGDVMDRADRDRSGRPAPATAGTLDAGDQAPGTAGAGQTADTATGPAGNVPASRPESAPAEQAPATHAGAATAGEATAEGAGTRRSRLRRAAGSIRRRLTGPAWLRRLTGAAWLGGRSPGS